MEGNVFSRVLSAGVLLIACFVLAACGGGGDGTDTGSADVTAAGSTEAGSGSEATTDEGETTDEGDGETTPAEDGESAEDNESAEDGEGAVAAPAVSGPEVKKAEYVKKGDEVCAKVPQTFQTLFQKVNAELEKEEKKQKKKFSKKEKEEEVNLKAAVPPLRTAIEEFAALGAPEGDEELAQEIVDALQKAADGLEADPSLPLTGKGSPFEEFVKLTKGYGFKSCPQL
ncbi:MAG TPA: hypothetical protein VFU11_08230 [Solirubrobacterales bacterium]|nr:hypothetical protein [Solirubrobacterales bacterium]